MFLIKVTTGRGQAIILITCTNWIRVTLLPTHAFHLISLATFLFFSSSLCTNVTHLNGCMHTHQKGKQQQNRHLLSHAIKAAPHTPSISRRFGADSDGCWWERTALSRGRVRPWYERSIGQGCTNKSASCSDVCHKAPATVAALRFMAALSVIAIF